MYGILNVYNITNFYTVLATNFEQLPIFTLSLKVTTGYQLQTIINFFRKFYSFLKNDSKNIFFISLKICVKI